MCITNAQTDKLDGQRWKSALSSEAYYVILAKMISQLIQVSISNLSLH